MPRCGHEGGLAISDAKLAINPGISVVFEGLDRTGKTTQRELLKDALAPETVVFAHMPSGFGPFTRRVYDALEAKGEKPASGLAQQLAHLACHAESIAQLVEVTESKALVLDRWWWSTLAYGWHGGAVEQSGLSEKSFRDLIRTIWSPVTPSVVFVFLQPHQLDDNNHRGVEAGYRALLVQYPDLAVIVPQDTQGATHDFVIETLIARGLARTA
jgi:dTMP kinase